MNVLFENPLPIYAVGAVLATLCGLVFLARRNLASLLALIGVLLLTMLLALVEQMVVTDREQVETALYELMAAVEANDVSEVLSLIDPAATKMRGDVEELMPQATIEDAGATAVSIEVYPEDVPPLATSLFRGRVDGVHRRSGQRLFYFDKVVISWIKLNDQWLAYSYTAHWKGRPIDAVDSMRGNRPAPAAR